MNTTELMQLFRWGWAHDRAACLTIAATPFAVLLAALILEVLR